MAPAAVLPAAFPAYLVDRRDGRFVRGLRELAPGDLPAGEVTIRVAWSGVNYKDGLAATEDGRVARRYPLVPGIDLAGTVVASDDPAVAPGAEVIVHGYDLGVAHHGGYAAYARVPSAWLVPLPAGLTLRDAMVLGTAGFTAALSVLALEERGLRPGDGPVLVTGASGGVGSHAVAILAARGHEAWAATGKPGERDRLGRLGASGFLDRADVTGEGRPLESARWAGAIDTVGGATLPYVLRTLRQRAAVALSGNAGGAELHTTVLPFILRGVALLGIDSSATPIERRRAVWAGLAGDLRPRALGEGVAEVTLGTLEPALDAILRGEARGRWIVRVGG